MAKLLYMSITQLLLKYVVNKDLELPLTRDDHEILVVSKDIITAISKKSDGSVSYESKYDNIDFLPSLFPTAKVMEIISNHGYIPGQPRTAYMAQLENVDGPYTDCLAIVGLLLDNPNITAILVCSDEEIAQIHHLEYLCDFLESEFGVMAYSYDEWEENHDVNIGDVEEIRTKYDENKRLTIESNNADVGAYFNKLTEDISDVIHQKLNNMNVDELVKFANNKGIYVSRRKPKDEIVEIIINQLS